MSALVLAVVGTDHHPFDRLVGWMDEWAAANPQAQVVVQYGTSRPPRHADGRQMLTRQELDDLLDAADIVVSHGGPATISEIRARGLLPIVVPRDPSLGEHVDGHQQRFARRMGASGFVTLCERGQPLHDTISAAAADRTLVTVDTVEADAQRAAAINTTTDLLDELIRAHQARPRRRRRVLP